MKSLETFEETFSDAVLGYLSTLIFSSFFFCYFRRKIVLLRHRAVVAYECLFSGLHDICNTFMQVAHTEILLTLRKLSNSEMNIKIKACNSTSCTLFVFRDVLIVCK